MDYFDPLMNKFDVASLLRCSERTVERQVKLGTFPPPQRFGRESLWFQSVVYAWIEKRRAAQQSWESERQGASKSMHVVEAAVPAPPPALQTNPAAGPQRTSSRAATWQGAVAARPLFQSAPR